MPLQGLYIDGLASECTGSKQFMMWSPAMLDYEGLSLLFKTDLNFLEGFVMFCFALGEDSCEKIMPGELNNLTMVELIPALSSVSILTPAFRTTLYLQVRMTSMVLAVCVSH